VSSPLALQQTKTALGLGNTASFLAVGGTPPYTYSVQLPGGQGGDIDQTGIYSSPPWSNYNSNPSNAMDTIIVTDSTGATATATILVGPPLILFLDIISTVLKLPTGRCFLYNTKGFQPKDPGLFVSVGVSSVKVFSNSFHYDTENDTYNNFLNTVAVLDVHAISVDNSALFLKEAVMMSLQSPYAIAQQNANAFSIGRVPPGGQFVDLSEVDGVGFPYHFIFSIALQYCTSLSQPTDVFTSFQQPTLVVNP
jgi:hypothetical protein